jgi:hypothetical protein
MDTIGSTENVQMASTDAVVSLENSLEVLLVLGLPDDTKLSARIRPLARELLMQLDPQDVAERMLAVQMIASFSRSMFLSRNANRQKNARWFKLYSGECDRAMTLFRQQMQTFTDLRRPRRTTFNAIRNANIAGQQIVITEPPNPTPDPNAKSLQKKKAKIQTEQNRPGRPAGKLPKTPPLAT